MARSFGPAGDVSPIEDYAAGNRFFHPRSGRHYEVTRRNGRVYQRRYELDSLGKESNVVEQEATFAIGSGNHARSFLHRSDSGELTQLPVTWYSQEGRWGMSPGYDNGNPPDFTRIADDSCLFCHNAYPAPNGDVAQGIDCQRCHGPGSRHVELASGGKARKEDIRSAIVDPARLTSELQMDVCMQCHLETTSAELPGMIRRFEREPFSFRAGEPLGSYMVYFDRAGADRGTQFEIVNQAYRLRQSACFLKSGGRLTCTTCHDPHDVPRGQAGVDYYRSKCVACHPRVTAAAHPDLTKAACPSCHMPRRRTEDAIHVTMTDHLIARRPGKHDLRSPLFESDRSYFGPLTIYYPERMPAGDRNIYLGVASITGSADRRGGIALLENAMAAGMPAKAVAALGEGYYAEGSATKAAGMFRKAAAQEPGLWKTHFNLGQALEASGEIQEARSEYEQAIRIKGQFPEAHYALANLMLKTGERAPAIVQFQQAIQQRPTYAEAHGNLANLYAEQGRLEDARSELEQALALNPAYAEAHNNLARVLAAQKRIPVAIEHAKKAVALDPKSAEARYNLARLLQEAGQRAVAIAEYRRTIRIKPDLAEAHLGLGQTLGDEGRVNEAIPEFREALRLKPDSEEAKRNLELALSMTNRRGH